MERTPFLAAGGGGYFVNTGSIALQCCTTSSQRFQAWVKIMRLLDYEPQPSLLLDSKLSGDLPS